MDLDTYFREYPEAEVHRGYLDRKGERGCLLSGVLPFTVTTAGYWGGPFPGRMAAYFLLDVRIWNPMRKYPPFEDAQKKALETIQQWLERKPKNKSHILGMLAAVEAGDADVVHQAIEEGTLEYPYRIWMMGNDDTSYSKWFASEASARAFLSMLEAAAPLDFDKDFEPFNWTFTN